MLKIPNQLRKTVMCQDMDMTFYQKQLSLQKTSHNLLKENKALSSSLKLSFHFFQFLEQ